MTDRERLASILERLAAATPGPWVLRARDGDRNAEVFNDKYELLASVHYMSEEASGDGPTNAALIANAPSDLQWLAERVGIFLDLLEEKYAEVFEWERERAAREFRGRAVEAIKQSQRNYAALEEVVDAAIVAGGCAHIVEQLPLTAPAEGGE